MRSFICIALLIATATAFGQSTQKQQATTRHPLTLSVESEVATNSMIQIGDDLSKSEIARLESSISKGLLPSHVFVPEDYDKKHLFLSVVATKFVAPGGRTYYAASTALTFGTVSGRIEYLNHNVILQSSLEKLGAAVAVALTSLELQLSLGTVDR